MECELTYRHSNHIVPKSFLLQGHLHGALFVLQNMVHAKMGCLMAGYLKVLPMWLIVFPGMISRILYTDDVACNEPDECEEICDSRTSCTNIAYPTLVLKVRLFCIRRRL